MGRGFDKLNRRQGSRGFDKLNRRESGRLNRRQESRGFDMLNRAGWPWFRQAQPTVRAVVSTSSTDGGATCLVVEPFDMAQDKQRPKGAHDETTQIFPAPRYRHTSALPDSLG